MSGTTQSKSTRIGFSAIFERVQHLLLISATVLLCIILSLRLQTLDNLASFAVEETGERINPSLYKTLSFGHLQSMVDLIWLRILEDSSITHVHFGKHPHVYYQLDLATDLDPAFYHAYVGGANLLAVIRDDGADARDLLLKGEHFLKEELPSYTQTFRNSFWGNAWGVPLLLAYTYLFELNDMPHAAIAFKEAAELPGSPQYLQHLVERLNKPHGEYEVGVKLLDFLIGSAKDPRTKEGYQKKRNALTLSELLYQLNLGFDEDLKQLKIKTNDPAVTQRHWIEFCDRHHKSDRDPFGGKLEWSQTEKRIISTTPHQRVFGLE